MRIPTDLARGWLSRLRWPSRRMVVTVGLAMLVLGTAIAATWLWFAAEQRRGTEAFAAAWVKLQQSRTPDAAPALRAQAISDLEQALSQKPSASVSAQAAYELANLKYGNKEYQSARTGYEMTAVGPSPTLRRLAQASVGNTWELQRDYLKAIEAYEAALASLKPADFLYDELLMDLARVQELAGRKDAAIKTYERVIANPRSRRSDDARSRLASLGAP